MKYNAPPEFVCGPQSLWTVSDGPEAPTDFTGWLGTRSNDYIFTLTNGGMTGPVRVLYIGTASEGRARAAANER